MIPTSQVLQACARAGVALLVLLVVAAGLAAAQNPRGSAEGPTKAKGYDHQRGMGRPTP